MSKKIEKNEKIELRRFNDFDKKIVFVLFIDANFVLFVDINFLFSELN